MPVQLSHDVRVVRSFEAALLHAYHSYLKKLLQASGHWAQNVCRQC